MENSNPRDHRKGKLVVWGLVVWNSTGFHYERVYDVVEPLWNPQPPVLDYDVVAMLFLSFQSCSDCFLVGGFNPFEIYCSQKRGYSSIGWEKGG